MDHQDPVIAGIPHVKDVMARVHINSGGIEKIFGSRLVEFDLGKIELTQDAVRPQVTGHAARRSRVSGKRDAKAGPQPENENKVEKNPADWTHWTLIIVKLFKKTEPSQNYNISGHQPLKSAFNGAFSFNRWTPHSLSDSLKMEP
jgi:hypothetical protein